MIVCQLVLCLATYGVKMLLGKWAVDRFAHDKTVNRISVLQCFQGFTPMT